MSYDVGEMTAHSPTLPSLYPRHSSFSNTSVASPTSQLILHPFRCFTYVTAHSTTLLSLLLRHMLFTYVSWRAADVVAAARKRYVSGQWFLLKILSTQSPLQAIEVYNGNFRTPCIFCPAYISTSCLK